MASAAGRSKTGESVSSVSQTQIVKTVDNCGLSFFSDKHSPETVINVTTKRIGMSLLFIVPQTSTPLQQLAV
tara:strand:- start:7594 stop:7809 length:216 start_codon:yes stop_codon:yes gene_type:complete